MIDDRLIAAHIFGSVSRGQHDDRSDLDILAVVRDGGGKVPLDAVMRLVPQELQALPLSVSWYGLNRFSRMLEKGELFAWHIFEESVKLYDPNNALSKLGTPQPYLGAVSDISSFRKVLRGIPHQIAASPGNVIYEAGLIYVCLRNICMAASWTLCPAPDFSRYSVFHLEKVRRCPISKEEFDLVMACRMAGQRGKDLPSISASLVSSLFERLNPWLDELCESVGKGGRYAIK